MSSYKSYLAATQGPSGSGNSYGNMTLQSMPQELDYVVHELRNSLEKSTIPKILGTLLHYLPYVKHEHNLRLLFASFLNNPLCFGNNNVPFKSNYLIIEVFKLITDKKLRISEPTLSVKKWYSVILKELENFTNFNPLVNSWKVLPIIAGIFSCNELRDELYTNRNKVEYKLFTRNLDSEFKILFKKCLRFSISELQTNEVRNLSLVSTAVIFQKHEKIAEYLENISPYYFIEKIMELMFEVESRCFDILFTGNNHEGIQKIVQEQLYQNPVIVHQSKFSIILEDAFKHLPIDERSFNLILSSLVAIARFNADICHKSEVLPFNAKPINDKQTYLEQQYWMCMKQLFFSEVLIFQGILTRFMHSNLGYRYSLISFQRRSRNLKAEYLEISLKILTALYYFNYILITIGLGGFDSYNFIYYLSLELSLKNGSDKGYFEHLTQTFIGNYNEVNLHPGVVNNNFIVKSKVLFVLGLWENYLQLGNTEKLQLDIFDISMNLADHKKYFDRDLVEAAHSVLLIYFSKIQVNNFKRSLEYVKLLFSQFPVILSLNQLSIAIETIGKQILSNPVDVPHIIHQNSINEFLEFLNFWCINTRSGVKLNSSESGVMLNSSQPVQEIEANSTLNVLQDEDGEMNNVVEANKASNPRSSADKFLSIKSAQAPYQFQERTTPETSKETLVVSLMNLIPYLPLSIFIRWLDKIKLLIEGCNQSERPFLIRILWTILSENLDINRSELAIRWWYETQRAVEVDNRESIIKL